MNAARFAAAEREMQVTDAAKSLLTLRTLGHSHEANWSVRREALASAIDASNDPGDLRSSLDLDVDDLLPIDLKTKIYERLLTVTERTPELLRRFAGHLQLHGPDWDDLARDLLAEANERDGL
jgi:hypothetical protein